MENLGIFESVFKRAVRDPFHFKKPILKNVLIVTDEKNTKLCDTVQDWLKDQPIFGDAVWACIDGSTYDDWTSLHKILEAAPASLVVTHRLLKESHESNRYSLGSYLDTMTQALACPVLVIPTDPSFAKDPLNSVIAVADHLSGHDALVNYAAAIAGKNGKLKLCHLEDNDVFSYYMEAIERIPEINSEVAREKIQKQLLAAPRHYIDSVRKVLKTERPDLHVDSIIDTGHLIDRYRDLIAKNKADLLVLESKDETQLAMHSLGYSLAVEFQETPLLLL